MKVLISGAGIAGPTLAYWLARHGMTPTIVEKAPRLRTGGYVVDFWGAGFDVARRMNLLPELLGAGYAIREVREVDREGRRAIRAASSCAWQVVALRVCRVATSRPRSSGRFLTR